MGKHGAVKYTHEIVDSMDIEPEEKAELKNLIDEVNRKTAECEYLQKEVISLAGESVKHETTLAKLEAEAAHWAEAEKEGRLVVLEGSCDSCRYKLQSDTWKYCIYPCSECMRRTKDHYTRQEAEAALERRKSDIRL